MAGLAHSTKRLNVSALLLLFLLGITTARGDTHLDKGWEQFDAGDIEGAYKTFTTLFKATPEDPAVNFALGRAAFEKNKPSHALLAFERVLMLEPDHDRARLELARTYYVMQHYEQAESHFRAVLANDPPDQVKETIHLFLKEIRRATKRLKLNGSLELRVFHDNNVNYGPADGEIDTSLGTLRVGDDSLPQDDYGYSVDAAYHAAYDFGDTGHWLSTAAVNYNQTELEDAVDQESRYAQITVGARNVGPRHMLDVGARVAHLNHGHTPYLDIYGGDAKLLVILRQVYQLTSTLSTEYRDFELDARDATYYSLAQSATRIFGKRQHSLGLTLRGFFSDSDDVAYRNSGVDVSVSGAYHLPMRTTLHAQVLYRANDYEAVTYPLLQSAPRQDDQYLVTAGIRKALTDNTHLGLYYQRVDNQSNFGLYDYTRDVVGGTLSLYF